MTILDRFCHPTRDFIRNSPPAARCTTGDSKDFSPSNSWNDSKTAVLRQLPRPPHTDYKSSPRVPRPAPLGRRRSAIGTFQDQGSRFRARQAARRDADGIGPGACSGSSGHPLEVTSSGTRGRCTCAAIRREQGEVPLRAASEGGSPPTSSGSCCGSFSASGAEAARPG